MKTITTVAEAINAIVHYNTLPPQIDYRVPENYGVLIKRDVYGSHYKIIKFDIFDMENYIFTGSKKECEKYIKSRKKGKL